MTKIPKCSDPSTDEINQFVTNKFGSDTAQRLKNQNQGGLNNAKGNQYEHHFVLQKAFEIASNNKDDLASHQIIQQNYGFVDDVCHIDHKNSHKHNFQLKNSSGNAANWTSDLEQKFTMQHTIDTEHLGYQKSSNTLVVSDPEKQIINANKIQQSSLNPNFNHCIYNPECANLQELFEKTNLPKSIKSLIHSDFGASEVDYAANLIFGVLQAHQNESLNLDEVFQKAQAEGRPNPFIQIPSIKQEQHLELHIKKLFEDYSQSLSYQVQYEHNKVAFAIGGFSFTAPLDAINQLTNEESLAISSIEQLVSVLMQLAAQSLQRKTDETL